MTEPISDSADRDPADEAQVADREIVALLQSGRPVPAPGFRGDLRRKLLAGPGVTDRAFGRLGFSLKAQVSGSLAAGLVLLAIAALGVAGAGPFAT